MSQSKSHQVWCLKERLNARENKIKELRELIHQQNVRLIEQQNQINALCAFHGMKNTTLTLNDMEMEIIDAETQRLQAPILTSQGSGQGAKNTTTSQGEYRVVTQTGILDWSGWQA